MNELQLKIAHCVNRGGLSLSEIARWLDVPLPTVRTWYLDGKVPRAYKMKHVNFWLAKLTELVDAKEEGVPLISIDVSLRNRASFLEKLKNENTRLLPEGAAA